MISKILLDDQIVVDSSFVNIEDNKLTKLIEAFNCLFLISENTMLISGKDEPIYLPADIYCTHHRIIFANNFFSSALHECSHWLVAGSKRRLLEDYGYWYKPDGRNNEEQQEFERVEVKPQALEWLLSIACDHKFNFSADNLSGTSTISDVFKESVYKQLLSYLKEIEDSEKGRLTLLIKALTKQFNQPYPIKNIIAID